MKKLLAPIYLLLIVLSTGCIKNTPVINSDSKVEFDAATWNSNAVGVTYPIFTAVPLYNAAGTNGTSITRTLATFQIRVNLMGAQKSTATTFNYRVVPTETTAIAGTHYVALTGTGTIPANSSFGYIDIALRNPGVSSATPVVLVLELQGNTAVAANVNYAKVGFSISQL